MTNKHKDIIRLARHWGATESYTRMIFEIILEEQRTLDELAQTPLHRGTRCLIIHSYTQRHLMTKKVVSIGEWTVEPFSNYEINDLLALVRKAKNDNLDDNYVYQYYNSLENKISRIGLALNSVGDT